MKIELNQYKYSYVVNLEDMKPFQIKTRFSRIEFNIPDDGVEIINGMYSFQIKNGKYRGCIGRLVRVLPVWNWHYTVKGRLSFTNNEERDFTFERLRITELPNTNLAEYAKPTYITNAFRQDIEKGDKVIISRNNQVYFGQVKEIRSNTCVTISLYPIRNDARKDIRINNLDGIIRWDDDLDFETMVSLLVLQA